MAGYPAPMQRLISELSRLPSIGEKSATRLAYHLITSDPELAQRISRVLAEAVEAVHLCRQCFFLSDQELCSVCRSPNRDASLLCIVEKPVDVVAIERVGEYRGFYHVLHGLWAPLKGQGPEQMHLPELKERLKGGAVREVILATSATVEGDATSLYLAQLLSTMGIRSTRLAQGIPKGGELEFADEITLARAFAGRSDISK